MDELTEERGAYYCLKGAVTVSARCLTGLLRGYRLVAGSFTRLVRIINARGFAAAQCGKTLPCRENSFSSARLILAEHIS